MNNIHPRQFVQTIRELDDLPFNNSFWQHSWSSQVNCLRDKLIVDNMFSYEDDGLYVNKCTAFLPNTMEVVEKFYESNGFVRFNPFVYRYNILENTNDNLIYEAEWNIFGFNKTAICYKKYAFIEDRKHFHLLFNIMDSRSLIVPFRDSHILFTAFVLEQVSSTFLKVSYISKSLPVPWIHPTDTFMALKRQQMALCRFFRAIMDISDFTEDVPEYVHIERLGFNQVLNGTKPNGTIVFTNPQLTITQESKYRNEVDYIAHGSFTKQSKFNLTVRSVIYLLFQNNCQIEDVVDKDTLIFKVIDNGISTSIRMSTFMYSDDFCLVHFHNIHSAQSALSKAQGINKLHLHFNSSYLFISKDLDDYWTVQYHFSIIFSGAHLNSKPYNSIISFIEIMETSLLGSDSSPQHQSQLSVMKLFTPQQPDFDFFMMLKSVVVKQICSYLSKKDLLSLQLTNKNIYNLIKYVRVRDASDLDDSSSEHSHHSNKTDYGIYKLGFSDSNSSPQHKESLSHVTQTPAETINTNILTNYVETNQRLEDSVKSPTTHFESKKYNGHTNVIRSIDIHPKQPLFVSGSSDRKIRLWKFEEPPEQSQSVIGPNSSVVHCEFIDDYICVAYKSGTIKYIQTEDFSKSYIFDAVIGKIEGYYPLSLNRFVVWNEDIQIISYGDIKQTVEFVYKEHMKKITVVRPFGTDCFISGASDRTVHLWDIRSPKPTIQKIKPHRSGVIQLEVLNDSTFYTVSNEKVIYKWDSRILRAPVFSIDNQTEILTINNDMLYCGCDKNIINVLSNDGVHVSSFTNDMKSSGISDLCVKRNYIISGHRNGDICVFKNDL